jgi:hypothetical protein
MAIKTPLTSGAPPFSLKKTDRAQLSNVAKGGSW